MDIAVYRRTVRNAVPAAQAFSETDSQNRNRASLLSAASTVTANAATFGGAIGGGSVNGDGNGVGGDGADVAANRRAAYDAVPAAQASGGLFFNELPR